MSPRPASAAAEHAAGTRFGVRAAGEPPRWARCVEHRGAEVRPFAAAHFGASGRRTLLVGGAGFDPRSLVVAQLLAEVAPDRVDGLFLREHRPNPDPVLLARAEAHTEVLTALCGGHAPVDLPVFESDGAVAVGRHAIDAIRGVDLRPYTDIVVDFSALSIGTSFPITRFLLERMEQESLTPAHDDQPSAHQGDNGLGERHAQRTPPQNLHAVVTARPTTDDRIVPAPSQAVQPIHGFYGRIDLDETKQAARLWMPQLRFGQSAILERLYDVLEPHDVVPVLPFPAHDPRLGDRLIAHYATEFDGRWAVDARSIVYADERSPLDFYRTVLRIHDGRHPVFASTGGNLLVLSPVGSKVLALGAMMAAAERDLPVMYVEALSYRVEHTSEDGTYSDADLVHVWLLGEAYPPPAGQARAAASISVVTEPRPVEVTADPASGSGATPTVAPLTGASLAETTHPARAVAPAAGTPLGQAIS